MGSRKSISRLPRVRKEQKFLREMQGESYMFMEDIRLRLFPSNRTGKKENSLVKLSSKDSLVINKVCGALNENSHDLSDALWHFFYDKVFISDLIENKKIYFEIIYYEGGDFSFEYIPSGTYVKIGKSLYQFDFRKKDNDRSSFIPKIIRIDSKISFSVSLPSGRRRELRGILRKLAKIGEMGIMPRFLMNNLKEGGLHPAYNANDYSEYRTTCIARITKDIGWGMRYSSDDYTFEYYRWVRHLRFGRFLNEVREKLIGDVNKALKKVNIDWEAPEIVLEDQSKKIDNAMQELKEGGKSFENILKAVLD